MSYGKKATRGYVRARGRVEIEDYESPKDIIEDFNRLTTDYEEAFARVSGFDFGVLTANADFFGRGRVRCWSWLYSLGHSGRKFDKSVWRVLTRHLGVYGSPELYQLRAVGRQVAAMYGELKSLGLID
jgi:hypothetical protein